MRLDLFALYTALGAGIWCAILTWIGWYLGTQAERVGVLPPEQVHRYVNTALLILAPALVLLIVLYVVRHRRKSQSAG
jgi:membrane protein DedA with SNARE-associated domain